VIRADGKVARGGNDALSCTKGAGRPRLGGRHGRPQEDEDRCPNCVGRVRHTAAAADAQAVCARVRGGATGKARVNLTFADCNWARTISSSSYLISGLMERCRKK